MEDCEQLYIDLQSIFKYSSTRREDFWELQLNVTLLGVHRFLNWCTPRRLTFSCAKDFGEMKGHCIICALPRE